MIFIKKIFSSSCLAVSFLFFIYTFYKAEFIWNGERSSYYSNYYVVSGILIIFSIFTFYLKNKVKEYLIILLIIILFTLYLFEAYLRLSPKPIDKSIERYEKRTEKKYDIRSKFEFYKDSKKTNPKISITVSPNIWLERTSKIFPLSGVSKAKTIYCNENGYYSQYQSDRYGFNNPDSEWDKKEIEYLIIGDSHVHGACVNRPNDISSVLRILANKPVLNVAYDGNGPLIEYAILKEFLNSRVKKVVWVYYEGNDMKNLSEEMKNNKLMNYLNNSNYKQNIKMKQSEVNTMIKSLIDEELKIYESKKKNNNFISKVTSFLTVYNLRFLLFHVPSQNQPKIENEFKAIIKKAKNLTSINNSKFFLVFLPKYNFNRNGSNFLKIKDIANELNITLIDASKAIFGDSKSYKEYYPFGLPGHYNERGHKEIADLIYKKTKD